MFMQLASSMRRYVLVACTATVSLVAGLAVISHFYNHNLCSGFIEENDLKIPVGATLKGRLTGIDEATFHRVIDKLEKIYAPIVKAKGGKLVVNRKWSDPTVNASAQRFFTTWNVNMYGGLARHPAITPDGFALVMCHEIGHHLGGAPKLNDIYSRWATNEGGADYFATLKCLRLYFDEASNAEWYRDNASSIPYVAIEQCALKWENDNDAMTCMRSTMAGLSVASLFQSVRSQDIAPALETPDLTVVSEMDDNHPGTQCRLDTYFAGALCDRPVTEQLSNTNYRAGSCAQPGYTFGYRPLCWFKP